MTGRSEQHSSADAKRQTCFRWRCESTGTGFRRLEAMPGLVRLCPACWQDLVTFKELWPATLTLAEAKALVMGFLATSPCAPLVPLVRDDAFASVVGSGELEKGGPDGRS